MGVRSGSKHLMGQCYGSHLSGTLPVPTRLPLQPQVPIFHQLHSPLSSNPTHFLAVNLPNTAGLFPVRVSAPLVLSAKNTPLRSSQVSPTGWGPGWATGSQLLPRGREVEGFMEGGP